MKSKEVIISAITTLVIRAYNYLIDACNIAQGAELNTLADYIYSKAEEVISILSKIQEIQ